MINGKTISSWVRQARYRARKNNIYSDLEIADVQTIIGESNDICQYCPEVAEVLDCPFPLKSGGPNVPANVVQCCKKCKDSKGNNDLIWMLLNGMISQDKYMDILRMLFKRRGGNYVKDCVRKATGIE